jgi:predicted transcriptional regulator
MSKSLMRDLSRRERQIMDYLFQKGAATAADVLANLPDPPSYSAVRATLKILETKGYVHHHTDGPRYIYAPIANRKSAQQSALRHVVSTFFEGSIAQVTSALLGLADRKMTAEELDRVAAIIEQARREQR